MSPNGNIKTLTNQCATNLDGPRIIPQKLLQRISSDLAPLSKQYNLLIIQRQDPLVLKHIQTLIIRPSPNRGFRSLGRVQWRHHPMSKVRRLDSDRVGGCKESSDDRIRCGFRFLLFRTLGVGQPEGR